MAHRDSLDKGNIVKKVRMVLSSLVLEISTEVCICCFYLFQHVHTSVDISTCNKNLVRHCWLTSTFTKKKFFHIFKGRGWSEWFCVSTTCRPRGDVPSGPLCLLPRSTRRAASPTQKTCTFSTLYLCSSGCFQTKNMQNSAGAEKSCN